MKGKRNGLLLFLSCLSLHTVSATAKQSSHVEEHKRQCNHLLHNIGASHCTGIENMYPEFNQNTPCQNNTECPTTPRITIVDYTPISTLMWAQISHMLDMCCGKCNRSVKTEGTEDVLVNGSPALKSSDLIFPVFGSRRSRKLYGYWFLPFMDAPPGLYVVKKKQQTALVRDLLLEVMELWPLLVILVFLALLAGFAVWAFETWSNEEEFSSTFLFGLLDGFWLAYISMTTVGYGDKTTRSIYGRIFCVLWILMGITIFSMLTASLTEMIGNSNRQASTSMSGKKVGVLNGRTYDMEMATRHGGILKMLDTSNTMDGIETLLRNLEKNDEGFLVDEKTFYYYMYKHSFTEEQKLQVDEHIILAKKHLSDEMSFGILVRHEPVYWYLSKFVESNWAQMDACRRNVINNQLYLENTLSKEKMEQGVFSTEGGLFQPTVQYCCILLAVAILFGVGFEVWKHNHPATENASGP